MPEETLRVRGYREFVRATNRAGLDARRAVRANFRQVGEPVRADAQRRFAKYSQRSATSFRVAVLVSGIRVEQGLRKTTGKRPDYGALQMRKALLPALQAKAPEVERAMEHAIDQVADHFDHG